MLKLSSRTRYGTRFMIELAARHGSGPISLREVAGTQDVSKGYLEQIAPLLLNAGLIRSVRGPGGGYYLAREPEGINLMQILEALEGYPEPVDCIGDPSSCTRAGFCTARDIWADLQETVAGKLRQINLGELVSGESDPQREAG
jgi:Rrf2 family protein